ncbi:MAG: DUF4238 domain-containing protein [Casimicrobium sp.]
MSGRKQHYIPQVLQRAFEAARTGSKCQVLVFRRGRPPYLTATEGSGAERDFYSNPLTDGAGALDDVITEFEGEHLAPMLCALKSMAPGEVDAEIAAVAVAHLAFRTAHLRGAMAGMADDAISQMQTIAEDAVALRRFVGIDLLPTDSPITEMIRETLSEVGGDDWPDKERSLAERLVAYRLRERFDDIVPQTSDALRNRLGELASIVPDAIPKAHTRVLSQSLVPESRVQPLRELKWSVVSVDTEDGHFILPDCVVVGSATPSGELQPYALLTPSEVSVVIMPLSSSQLLVGSAHDYGIQPIEVNSQLARCSLDFFVSSRKDKETAQIADLIGDCVAALKLDLFDHDDSRVDDEPFSAPHCPGRLKIRVPSGRFGEIAKTALAKIAETSLDQFGADEIESIIVPANMRAELQTHLERAPTEAELQAVAFGQVYAVKAGNVWKCRVVLPRKIIEALTQTQDPSMQLVATRVIKHNLGKSYYFACWAHRCPSIFAPTFVNEWQQLVAMVVFRACSEYFGGMACTRHESALLPSDDRLREVAQFIALGVEGLAAARRQYFMHRNIDQLLRDALPSLETILVSVASISGILEAKATSIGLDSDAGIVLRTAGLWDWSRLFANDLRRHYESRFRWSTEAELSEFGPHIERLLWTIGIFVSQIDEGTWIDVKDDQQLALLNGMLST